MQTKVMFKPTRTGQTFNRTLAVLFLIGALCSSTIDSFVHVHAYQKSPASNELKSAATAEITDDEEDTAAECVPKEKPAEIIDDEDDSYGRAQRIMYNQLSRKRESVRYQIIAAEACEPLARRMAEKHPDRFVFHETEWRKFPDGTDNIEIGGFSNPHNVISGEKVLFLASFHSNDATLSQFQVMICLLQSFIESLTVVLPFSPVGTMERVTKEGQVATAATYAHSKSVGSCSSQ